MPRAEQSIPSLLNGVSQQPASQRHLTQCEAQVNGLATLADGLTKRPPLQHVAQLNTDTPGSLSKVHFINRDTDNQYTVLLTDDTVKVYDLDGTEMTIQTPDGVGYLNSSNPRADFRLLTIADTTFIVNRTVTTAMDSATTGGSLTGTVQLFSDLPAGSTGNIYEITGDPSTAFDNYFVIKLATGVWEEHVEPGIEYQFDASTMPHKLVKTGATEFTFSEITWDDREVGDEASNPNPSFIGNAIEDVFLHKNRLGFLSDENFIMSRSGDYFNFWSETVTTTLDTDPIDKGAAHTKVALLKHAVAFNETMLLFSEQTQFALTASGVLSNNSANLVVTTEFEVSESVRPIGVGQNVYFAVPAGEYTAIREYFVEPDTVTNDAADITAHISTYIPKNVHMLAASSAEDIIIALTSEYANRIYVYKYYWQGDEKVLSSWSYWELHEDISILGAHFIQSTLYVTFQADDGIHLGKIDLSKSDETITDLGWIVHLDLRDTLTGVYSSGDNWTTWTLPYDIDTGTDVQVVLGSGHTQAGKRLTTTRPTDGTVRATGDWSADDAFVGVNYEFRYRFSEQFVLQQAGAKQTAILTGRLQLQRMSVRYEDTARFDVEVSSTGRDTATYHFSGTILGNSAFTIGSVPIVSGVFKFPILARSSLVNIDLVNNTHQPSTFLSAEWQGAYTKRGV